MKAKYIVIFFPVTPFRFVACDKEEVVIPYYRPSYGSYLFRGG